MPLWLGANEQPMYSPNTPWWIAANASALAAGGCRPPEPPGPGGDLTGGERQHTVTDVGVVVFLVGVGVVAVVFAQPPPVAEPGEQPRSLTEPIVAAPSGEDLLMAAVVGEERDWVNATPRTAAITSWYQESPTHTMAAQVPTKNATVTPMRTA